MKTCVCECVSQCECAPQLDVAQSLVVFPAVLAAVTSLALMSPPGVCDCAKYSSAVTLAVEAWRWDRSELVSVSGSDGLAQGPCMSAAVWEGLLGHEQVLGLALEVVIV